MMNAPVLDLAVLGWDDAWIEAAAAFPGVGQPGRITRVDRGLCNVLTSDGPVRVSLGSSVLEAMVADTLSAPCAGDWCLVRQWPDGPQTAEVLLPRRTAVTRAEAPGTSRGQVLATNVDYTAAVVALHPAPELGYVEGLLSLAQDSGAVPVIVLTKADAVDDPDVASTGVRRLAGVRVICTSTVTGEGIAELRALIGASSTLALLGAARAGKSSLTNALVGTDTLVARRVRTGDKGGRVAVRRELLLLPGGGAVIDTPGLDLHPRAAKNAGSSGQGSLSRIYPRARDGH